MNAITDVTTILKSEFQPTKITCYTLLFRCNQRSSSTFDIFLIQTSFIGQRQTKKVRQLKNKNNYDYDVHLIPGSELLIIRKSSSRLNSWWWPLQETNDLQGWYSANVLMAFNDWNLDFGFFFGSKFVLLCNLRRWMLSTTLIFRPIHRFHILSKPKKLKQQNNKIWNFSKSKLFKI